MIHPYYPELTTGLMPNKHRVQAGLCALIVHNRVMKGEREDVQTCIVDLIGDLLHTAVGAGVDIDDIMRSVYMHFSEEIDPDMHEGDDLLVESEEFITVVPSNLEPLEEKLMRDLKKNHTKKP